MPRYTVHGRSTKPEVLRAEVDRIRFVKEGFSWWGLFFPLPWMLIKGMWECLVLAIIILIAISFGGAALEIPELPLIVASFNINIITGFLGNDFYRWTLSRRGLVDIGPASGDSREEAELRFFLALPSPPQPEVPSPIMTPVRGGTRDALGLFEAAGAPR